VNEGVVNEGVGDEGAVGLFAGLLLLLLEAIECVSVDVGWALVQAFLFIGLRLRLF